MSNEVTIKGPLGPIRENSYRGKTLYSAVLENDDRWFGCGDTKPPAESGQMVEVTMYKNDKGYWTASSITKCKEQPVQNVAQAASSASSSYDARQMSIILQSSRKEAVELLKLAREEGALSIPSKKADKLPYLVATLDEITKDLFASIMKFDYQAALADEEADDADEGFDPNPTTSGDE